MFSLSEDKLADFFLVFERETDNYDSLKTNNSVFVFDLKNLILEKDQVSLIAP